MIEAVAGIAIFGAGFLVGAWWCATLGGRAMGAGLRRVIRMGIITEGDASRIITLIEEE